MEISGGIILGEKKNLFLAPSLNGLLKFSFRERIFFKELKVASSRERIVIIAGVPISIPGTTNLIKIEIVE